MSEKCYQNNVEAHYQHLAGVEKLAVVGITDNITKCDIIHAAIVPDETLLRKHNGEMAALNKDIEKVIFQRAGELPQYLRIVHVDIFDRLPTNALGKIKRSEIKDWITEKNAKEALK